MVLAPFGPLPSSAVTCTLGVVVESTVAPLRFRSHLAGYLQLELAPVDVRGLLTSVETFAVERALERPIARDVDAAALVHAQPRIAERVIAYREKNGGFRSVDERGPNRQW